MVCVYSHSRAARFRPVEERKLPSAKPPAKPLEICSCSSSGKPKPRSCRAQELALKTCPGKCAAEKGRLTELGTSARYKAGGESGESGTEKVSCVLIYPETKACFSRDQSAAFRQGSTFLGDFPSSSVGLRYKPQIRRRFGGRPVRATRSRIKSMKGPSDRLVVPPRLAVRSGFQAVKWPAKRKSETTGAGLDFSGTTAG